MIIFPNPNFSHYTLRQTEYLKKQMETLDSSIFDLTPIPMWIEDFSEVKQLFDLWRNQGVENLYEFLSQNENLIVECAHKIKIIKVNQKY